MGFIGSVIKLTGKVAGKTAEYGIKATGGVISIIADSTDNPDMAKKSIKISKEIGEFVDKTTEKVGAGLGTAIDKTIEISSATGGAIGGYIAKSNGGDEKQIEKAKMIGRIVGGGAVGLATGDLIGTAITGITAATGVASTGTAISAIHGAAATNATLAHIGGGALAAGGGGIAAGQTILHTIDAVTTLAGSIDGSKKKIAMDQIESSSKDNSKYVYADYEVTE